MSFVIFIIVCVLLFAGFVYSVVWEMSRLTAVDRLKKDVEENRKAIEQLRRELDELKRR